MGAHLAGFQRDASDLGFLDDGHGYGERMAGSIERILRRSGLMWAVEFVVDTRKE